MTKRRIALSASFYMVPCVQSILRNCDAVYSTNIDKKDELYDAIGRTQVHFIPFGTSRMHDALKEFHGPDCEYINFSDLTKAIHESLVAGSKETARILAGYFGWEILCDEEGIDGEENEHWARWDGTASHTCLAGEVPAEVFASMVCAS